jgi:hypothetical protein
MNEQRWLVMVESKAGLGVLVRLATMGAIKALVEAHYTVYCVWSARRSEAE